MGDALHRRIKQARFDNPGQEAMLNLLIAADHVRRHIDTVCTKYGITSGQYNVLRILRGAHPQGHPRCEIVARMIERAPDVTRLIDRLENQGLVERTRSVEDRRQSIAVITPKGLTLLEEMLPEMLQVQDWWMARVTEADCLELSRICETLYSDEP